MLRALLLSLLLTTTAQAAQQRTCDNLDANAGNVDWDQPTRTFANGKIRMIKIDIEEPACCAVFLMALYPVPDQPFPGCTLVGVKEGYGYNKMNLETAVASYDARIGLTVRLPVVVFDSGAYFDEILQVTVNQALGLFLAR